MLMYSAALMFGYSPFIRILASSAMMCNAYRYAATGSATNNAHILEKKNTEKFHRMILARKMAAFSMTESSA